MRITGIERRAGRSERVAVHVDGAFRCELAAELVQAAQLRPGDAVDEATLRALERKDLVWRAREAGLRLLEHRARTRAEMRRRLLGKGFPPDVVEACVAELEGMGLLDDRAFAEAFARDRLRLRPRGRRLLVRELRARGVEQGLAEAAVSDVLVAEGESEHDAARRAAEAWVRRSPRRRDRRRLYGYLARRGFSAEVIRAVVEDLLGDAAE